MSMWNRDKQEKRELENEITTLRSEKARLQRKLGEMETWAKMAMSKNEQLQQASKAWDAEKHAHRELVSAILHGSGLGTKGWPQVELSANELKESSILLATVQYLTAMQTFDAISKWHMDRSSIESAAFVVGLKAYGLVHVTGISDVDKRSFLSSVIEWLTSRVKYVEFSHSGLETRFNEERHVRTGSGSDDHVTPLSFLVRDRHSDHVIYKAWVK